VNGTPEPRCGTVVLAGAPNAGKSTLLNALIGIRLAIVSPMPQSTRTPVIGVRTDPGAQLVFIDPPGLLEPDYLLQETMLEAAVESVRHSDVVLHLHRAALGPHPRLESILPAAALEAKPVASVLTAVDELPPHQRPDAVPATFSVSAVTGEGIDSLIAWCSAHVPVGPFRYDADDVSTQPMRFFVEEAVREAAFDVLRQELPYAIATQVEEYREDSNPLLIRVTLFVERESQKGIVIGTKGRTLKRIGSIARRRIEELTGSRVYLDLWTKVLPRWRKSPTLLRQLGFRVPTSRNV
jgi:GTP-binding protein Era